MTRCCAYGKKSRWTSLNALQAWTGVSRTQLKILPDTPRGLGVVYRLESTATGKRMAVRTATPRQGTSRTAFSVRHMESRRLPGT